MSNKFKCYFFHDLDLFGKEAEFYYKGENKKSSLIGRIFTVLYIMIYLAFLIYKLIRMHKKVDVTFYQTTAYTGETPKIQLTNEIFYGGFALANARTLQPFIDPTIYNINVQFRIGKKINHMWVFDFQRIELEVCQLQKFSPKYQDLFKDFPLENMYCPKEMNLTLEGHTTYDVYSYFYVGFYPCVNSSTVNNCKPKEIIDAYLKNAYVSFKMQDIELTPQIYGEPIQLRAKEVSSPVSKNLFQNINAYFQVVEIETDNDIVGFEALENIKKNKYLKYNGPIVLSRLNDDIEYQDGQALCDVTIQLTEQILTITRTYTKLIVVLGDVGGFMEVFYLIFKVISSFITNILYEKSMVNNLFEFDLDKKMVILKELRRKKKRGIRKSLKNDFNNEKDIKVFIPTKKSKRLSVPNTIFTNEELTIHKKNKLNEEPLKSNNKLESDSNFISYIKSPKKRKKSKFSTIKLKSSFSSNLGKLESNDFKSKNLLQKNSKFKDKDKDNIYNIQDFNELESKNISSNEERKEEKKIDKELSFENFTKTKKKNIVTKININKLCVYFCFLCVKKRKNYQNILIEEGKEIITHYLDILNIFKKLFRDEKIQEKLNKEKDDKVKMSEETIIKLKNIDKKYKKN